MDPQDAQRYVDLSDDQPLVPETPPDDTDEGWGERARERPDEHDEWLQEQRPPHWD